MSDEDQNGGKVTLIRRKPNRLDPFEEMFQLREEAIEDPGLRAIYPLLVRQMRHDAAQHGVSGAVEMLMIERVVFEYVWMRDRERLGVGVNGINPNNPDEVPGFPHERSWRDTIAQWYDAAYKLQRAMAREEPDPGFVRDQALREAGVIISQVCDKFYGGDEEMKERFAEAFDELEDASV
jgi:hypothetical protein